MITSPLAFRSRLSRASARPVLVFRERFSHTFPRVHFAKKSAIFDNHLLHGRAKLTFLKQTRQNWQKSETIRCMRVTELLTVRNDY